MSGTNHLKEEVAELVAKAKLYGGDPFQEYRKKKTLPKKYEYWMNCFFDRLYEQYDREVVQKAYEELKKNPKNYVIEEDVLPGIPVLFAVSNLDVGLNTFNAAVKIINLQRSSDDEFTAEQLKRAITYIEKAEGEDEQDFMDVLFLINMHFMNLSVKLAERGSISAAKRLEPHSKEMQQIQKTLKKVAGAMNPDWLAFMAFCAPKLMLTAQMLGIDVWMLAFPQERIRKELKGWLEFERERKE